MIELLVTLIHFIIVSLTPLLKMKNTNKGKRKFQTPVSIAMRYQMLIRIGLGEYLLSHLARLS